MAVSFRLLLGVMILHHCPSMLTLVNGQSSHASDERRPWLNDDANVETLTALTTLFPPNPTNTPSTPRPEDIECYVDVVEVSPRGGTCVRYGLNSPWMCQSGAHAAMSRDCQRRAGRTRRRRRREGRRRNRRNHRIQLPNQWTD